MHPALKTAFAAGAMIQLLTVPTLLANEAMPAGQQNALVQKYCTVCHTDAARNGGLSLQHFDAAHLPPSLAAMMVSKMKGGAMGAAGITVPDKVTVTALTNALAFEAKGANGWDVSRTQDPATNAPLLTVSILRELPFAKAGGDAAMYRLVLECNAASHKGEMQLAWAPSPASGTLSVTVDGETPLAFRVEGTEIMGNGSKGTTGPAAVSLYNMRLPAHTLGIKDLFANESVEFSFDDLPQAARQSLAACFTP